MRKILFPIIALLYFQGQAQVEPDQSSEFEVVFRKPIDIVKVNESHYFIDFGKAFFGTVVLKSKTLQQDSIFVSHGEKLRSVNTIDSMPGGHVRYQQVTLDGLTAENFTTIQLPADERNTNEKAIALPDSFGIIMPFRYCEIKNLKIPITDLEIYQKAYHYRFNDDASYFSSSDTILNAIWDLCKHTIKATSFAGYYIDGDRERIPYEADAYINQLSHYSVDSVYSLARKTNLYFLDHPTWPTEWLLHVVLLYYTDYMYTGELDLLRDNYEMLKIKSLMELAREDGLISSKSPKLTEEYKQKLGFKATDEIRDIVDWPPSQDETGWKLATKEGERDGYEMVDVNTVVNAFYYQNLVLLSKIAGYLDKEEDSKMFHEKSQQLKEAINTKLFDQERGIYVDGEGSNHASLHANMMPLAFDLVPEKYLSSVISFMRTRGMACSVYGAQYLLEGLVKNGAQDYALHLITDTTHDRTWWNMIEKGSTMTFEAWDQRYKPNMDWNHAWGAAPANIITMQLWGITPSEPGFKAVRICPRLDNFQYSEIKTPTKEGIILCSYSKQENGDVQYKIELPENMNGIFIQSQKFGSVVVNGENRDNFMNTIELKPGGNILEFEN
ncbi:MAG: family 78 glycoside hydrolase catalytic domain [Bacteroidales bacterium]|nr:family 78 glycoside hydrolase catalytic domain [Bacteroidales bacterium]